MAKKPVLKHVTKAGISPEMETQIEKVKGKRARAVIDHILKHGHVTTEDLEKMGYAHAPRAARDVRENGIPLKTTRVRGESGKLIAAYEFGDSGQIKDFKLGGRKVFSKPFKAALLEKYGSKCAVCNVSYPEIYLQIDHRVPYEVGGDPGVHLVEDFMLLCATCNRKKSWSCEHCLNWTNKKDPDVCQTCFWANPDAYSHIAMKPIRRAEIAWTNAAEVADFESTKKQAKKLEQPLSEYIKRVLREKK